jgi:nitrite reductase/ring-hydroxylating ferredoxin subunit
VNPACPAPGTVLCDLEAIANWGAKGFIFRAGSDLFMGFVLREGGEVRGYVDSCPHTGQPLAFGPDRYLTRDGKFILCSGHGALFLKGDGECVGGPCAGERLEAWAVEVVEGVVRTA